MYFRSHPPKLYGIFYGAGPRKRGETREFWEDVSGLWDILNEIPLELHRCDLDLMVDLIIVNNC